MRAAYAEQIQDCATEVGSRFSSWSTANASDGSCFGAAAGAAPQYENKYPIEFDISAVPNFTAYGYVCLNNCKWKKGLQKEYLLNIVSTERGGE